MQFSPIQQLIFSGDVDNYELARQLSISQGLDLAVFQQLEACAQEFSLLTQTNCTAAELFAQLKNSELVKIFYKNIPLSDAWAVFAPFLTHFYLTQHLWEAVPPVIAQWKGLKQLDLRNGKLKTISDFVYELPELENLILYNNPIDTIDENIAKAQKLQQLSVSSPHFIGLPDALAQLPLLHSLAFGGSNLINEQQIPSIIFDCTHLTTLELKGQCFYQLPPEIAKLHRLQSLRLEHCNFSRFPRELLMLPNLVHLELSFLPHANKLLKQIPHFQGLKRLNLYDNDFGWLKKLPVQEWGFLERLELISFSFLHAGNQQQQPHAGLDGWLKQQLPNTEIITIL